MKFSKILAIALASGLAASASAAVRGTVTTAAGRQSGLVTWSQVSKKYTVQQRRANGPQISTEIPAKDVVEIEIDRPAALEGAIKARNKAALEKIVKEYAHLQWDVPAAAALADFLREDGAKAKALKVCTDLIATNPDASWKGELAPAYWRALLANNKSGELEKEVAKALKGGDRFSSASALVLRGDMILKQGRSPKNARKALLDGYLRALLLYTEKDIADRVGAEARMKAAECFELMGNPGRAAELRSANR